MNLWAVSVEGVLGARLRQPMSAAPCSRYYLHPPFTVGEAGPPRGEVTSPGLHSQAGAEAGPEPDQARLRKDEPVQVGRGLLGVTLTAAFLLLPLFPQPLLDQN